MKQRRTAGLPPRTAVLEAGNPKAGGSPVLDALRVAYPWTKALHIVAVVSWMAGLFYLPRLFVYHAERAPAAPPALQEDEGAVLLRRARQSPT